MKKNYNQPVVEAAQLQLNTIVLAGSPGGGDTPSSMEIGDEIDGGIGG